MLNDLMSRISGSLWLVFSLGTIDATSPEGLINYQIQLEGVHISCVSKRVGCIFTWLEHISANCDGNFFNVLKNVNK